MADRLISCDDHMDLSQLPADLWTTRLPASLLDRAPHVEERGEAEQERSDRRELAHDHASAWGIVGGRTVAG